MKIWKAEKISIAIFFILLYWIGSIAQQSNSESEIVTSTSADVTIQNGNSDLNRNGYYTKCSKQECMQFNCITLLLPLNNWNGCEKVSFNITASNGCYEW